MFFKKRQQAKGSYDHENKKPVIRASICTGEQVAGFKDLHTGAFEEIMLIRNNDDLLAFKERYGIEGEIEKMYLILVGGDLMLFGRKKTRKIIEKNVNNLNKSNKKNTGRMTSENRKAVMENKEDKQDWIDELAMLDEIFDD